ncbi:hypothetical protein SAMN05421736_1164 [Evansella caseinilytica]|uniref:Uncharacterized protein n=1 Tax=Evansella caseinilytica TaxID=1503961 RepID=A0A1H3TTC4_9BACI|nr:hypothetical protein [Evansella caseinilytica]SDZ53071.1 hypothetical protein SAMN05421736_1164 [Evansella caseinilytica]
MNHLPLLTEDEARYIISVIPLQDTVSYFKHNPKQFSQIRPGFRATSISKVDASNLLFSKRSRKFVSSFIEKHISKWLSQVQEQITKCMDDGDSKDIAFIHTLPFSFFAGNVGLYFKLVNDEYSEEYIALMSAIVKNIKEVAKEQEELKEKIKALESQSNKLQEELETKNDEWSRNSDRFSDKLLEMDALKDKFSILEKLQTTSFKDKEEIEKLKIEKKELHGKIDKLLTEITEIKNNSRLLEEQIRDELVKKQKRLDEAQSFAPSPKCPRDIDEFKEYLGYNLINIGVPNDTEYFPLLISYLSKILFRGAPIVVNHAIGINIIKCAANTLMGKSTVKTLPYSQDITNEKIREFLLSSDRVVCLDNFIGNYNETELIPLIEKHRDKIVFLTVIYDRTLRYLSQEFLRYCHYFNANRIGMLSIESKLSEDPSTIVEHSYKPKFTQGENRFRNIFREILRELSYPQSIIEHKCESIANEQDLCQSLAFDILPYCIDVLQMKPYNTSERLLKYAGKDGRCPQRNLLVRWFAQ